MERECLLARGGEAKNLGGACVSEIYSRTSWVL